MKKMLPAQKARMLVFVLGNILFIFGCLSAGDWPNYRGDPQCTGYTQDEVSLPLVLKWYAAGEAEEDMMSAFGGLVFQGQAAGNRLNGYDLCSGALVREFTWVHSSASTPALEKGRVYTYDFDSIGNLFFKCIDSNTGADIWAISTAPAYGTPMAGGAIIEGDYIYFGATHWESGNDLHTVYIWAVNKMTGAILSGFPVSQAGFYTGSNVGLCVDNERVFFIGPGSTRRIHGYSLNGSALPNFPITTGGNGGFYYRNPVIAGNKLFFYNRSGGSLMLYGHDIMTGSALPGFPASAGTMGTDSYYGGISAVNGIIYSSDGAARLHATRISDGTTPAGFPVDTGNTAPARVWSVPCVSSNNVVFTQGGNSKKIFAIGGVGHVSQGSILWQYTMTHGDVQGPDLISPIITGNRLLAGVDDGGIYCFGPELTLCKSVDRNTAAHGETLTYTISVDSNGASGAKTNVVIVDTIPACAVYVAGSATGSPVLSGNLLVWNIGSFPADTTASYTYAVEPVWCAAGTTVTNRAVIYADGLGPFTSNRVDVILTDDGPPLPTPTVTQTSTVTPISTQTLTATVTPTKTPVPPPLELIGRGNYPNPVLDGTEIVYWISEGASIDIKIYTVSGEVVLQKNSITAMSGNNSFFWDRKNNDGNPVASGIFLYSVIAKNNRGEKKSYTGKLAVIK